MHGWTNLTERNSAVALVGLADFETEILIRNVIGNICMTDEELGHFDFEQIHLFIFVQVFKG